MEVSKFESHLVELIEVRTNLNADDPQQKLFRKSSDSRSSLFDHYSDGLLKQARPDYIITTTATVSKGSDSPHKCWKSIVATGKIARE